MHLRFLETLCETFSEKLQDAFPKGAGVNEHFDTVVSKHLWKHFTKALEETSHIDSSVRFQIIAKRLQPEILVYSDKTADVLPRPDTWTQSFSLFTAVLYNNNRSNYLLNPDATSYLGTASAHMYTFVRKNLKVPFLQEATITTPSVDEAKEFDFGSGGGPAETQESMDQTSPTMGGYITRVYESMRSGELYKVVGACMEEV